MRTEITIFIFVGFGLLTQLLAREMIHGGNANAYWPRTLGLKVWNNSNSSNCTRACSGSGLFIDDDVLTQKRFAYVVTLNTTSPRFIQTKKVLSEFGFDVTAVEPFFFGLEKPKRTLSNKIAMLTVATLISRGAEPWGYIFEDDVYQHELSSDNLSTVIESEAGSTLFHYLGICTLDQPEHFMCGRCAHAMGLSREGASELLRYANLQDPRQELEWKSPGEEIYLDVIVEGWCEVHPPGFRVIGPLQNSVKGGLGHYGIFIQDRTNFPSEIMQAPDEK